MGRVGLFHLGPPKTGTTWLYQCLREHPGISAPRTDTVHFFDMHFHRGEAWYHQQFGSAEGTLRFDPTPAYICSPRAPGRIARYNPDAKLIVCLRNPVDRAFSHWWHLKKSGATSLGFEDVLVNYNSYATWLEHGFVAIGLERIVELFGRERLHVMDFDEMRRNPADEYRAVCEFAGIDPGFTPSPLNKRVNVAGARKDLATRVRYKLARTVFGDRVHDRDAPALVKWMSGKSEYLDGIPPALRAELLEAVEPEIRATERVLGMNLDRWRP